MLFICWERNFPSFLRFSAGVNAGKYEFYHRVILFCRVSATPRVFTQITNYELVVLWTVELLRQRPHLHDHRFLISLALERLGGTRSPRNNKNLTPNKCNTKTSLETVGRTGDHWPPISNVQSIIWPKINIIPFIKHQLRKIKSCKHSSSKRKNKR